MENGAEMGAKVLVSVIMPAYNAEKYIGAAIESILNQTYKNFELIIIEDCSTDETLNVIKKYNDSRIKLLQNERNLGIAYSTNRGIAYSQGKYIALLDDDDMAAPERLELQVNYLEEHTDIDILGGRSNRIDAEGNLLRQEAIPRYNPKYIKATLLFQCLNFRNGTTMIRREFIDKYGLQYQENCYGMQDFKFFIDSSKVGNISAIVDLLLYHRVHDKNETKRRITKDGERRRITYARFQRDSLAVSGYKLDEKEMSIINRMLAEDGVGCRGKGELQLLYEVFCKIVQQAKDMQVDYLAELEQYCKIVLSNQVKKLIKF